jgi:hypothetical protein
MAFDIKILGNDAGVTGKLVITNLVELGFANTADVDRTIRAIGSEPNISIILAPKGTGAIKVPSGYASLVTSDDDLVNRGFINSKVAGKNVSSLVTTPTITENGFAIVWDNTANQYTLAAAASSKSFNSGLEDVANVIKLGGTPLDRNTDITGAFTLKLGTTGSKLSNIELNATTRIDIAGGTSKLILNGTNPVELIGGLLQSSIIIDAGGGIILTDNQGGVSQRGLRGASSYAATVQDNDYVQKVYVDNRIGGKSVDSILKTPTSGQNGYSIIWNDTTQQYTLASVTGIGTSTVPKAQSFVTDGIASSYEVTNGTILHLNFVEINGDVQTEGTDYTRSGQFINTGVLPSGLELTIRYWEDLSVGGGGGGSGGGHVIQNSGVPLAQRADLNITNGLSASDVATVTTLKLGGTFTENTTLNGVDTYSLTFQNLTSFSLEGNTISLITPSGASIVVENSAVQTFQLGVSGGAILNLGGDARGDLYVRNASGKLVRLPVGANGEIITSNGTDPVYAAPSATIVNADETTKGGVEEATDAQMQAATAVGETGAKLFGTPTKLATWWTWLKTQTTAFTGRLSGKHLAHSWTALVDAGTIAWNADTIGNFATVTLGGNRTLGAITNPQSGGLYIIKVIQDGTGNRTLAFNAQFVFGASITPILNSAIGAFTVFTFFYDGTSMNYCGASGDYKLANLFLTAQVAAGSDQRPLYIDSTGKIFKSGFVNFSESAAKVTITGNTITNISSFEVLNSSLASIMKLYNDQNAEFGGGTGVISILNSVISGGAYLEINDNQAEAFKITDKTGNLFVTYKSTTGSQSITVHKRIKYDHDTGFSKWHIQAFVRTSTTAAAVNLISSVAIPTDFACHLKVDHLFAYATDNSVVAATGDRDILAKNVGGTVTGALATYTTLALPATTAVWALEADDPNNRININFTNTTGAGKTFDVAVDYTYILQALPSL